MAEGEPELTIITNRLNAADVVKGIDLLSRKIPPMACCPRCEEATPLIGTIVFYQAEFYCLECGGRFGFLDPRTADPSPELSAHHARLQAEWDEHAGRRLIVEGRTPVSGRAAEQHRAAMAWLAQRARP